MALNPIISVNGASIPCPSHCQYSIQDVSESDAGRTEDALMHAKKIAQKVKLELAWQNVSFAKASLLMNTFDPEYVEVRYFDLKRNAERTATFYTGDKSANIYNMAMGIVESVQFNIIER